MSGDPQKFGEIFGVITSMALSVKISEKVVRGDARTSESERDGASEVET